MSLFQSLLGTMKSEFFIGGPTGIKFVKTTDGFEVRNADGSALQKLTASVLIADSEVQTDAVNEKTLDAGVTIDGVLVKDGEVDGVDVSTLETTVSTHTSDTNNPHNVTKTQVGLGNVVDVDTTTTANITDSTDKRFVTDAQLTVIGNTSGTNTGDQDLSGLVPKTTTVNGHALSADVTVTKSDVGLDKVDNVQQLPMSYLDTDTDLGGALTSDSKVASQKAVKAYVDAVAQGLTVHAPARLATIDVLPACTPSGSQIGKTLTADANGALSIDGIAVVAGNRILVKNQVSGADNGVYVVTAVGDASNPFVLTRATDFDGSPASEVVAGSFFFIEEGNTLADTGFVLTTNNPITVDTTELAFAQFSGAGQVIAGDGLSKSGNTLNVNVDDSTIEIDSDSLRIKGLTSANITDLTDAGDSALHYHASDRDRANHTGTQTASTISDFDSAAQAAITVSDTNSVDLTYTTGQISADVKVDSTTLEITASGVGVKSGVFDAAGDATQALSDANDYTDTAVTGLAVDNTVVHLADDETITGIKTFDNGLKTDTISEETSAAGVTIDGLLIKDGVIRGLDVDINGTTAETEVSDSDTILIYDVTAGANRKMTRANFLSGIAVANGISKHIKFTVGTTSVSSSNSIPANAVIKSVVTVIDTAYDTGNIQLIVDGTADLEIQATSENEPTVASVYESRPFSTVQSNEAGSVRAVVTGTPASGAATVIVEYVEGFLA